MDKAESIIRGLLARADVEPGGSRPWDMTVRDQKLYERLLRDGVLGLGEAYVDGWWDCDDIPDFIRRVILADLENAISPWKLLLPVLKAKIVNIQSRSRAAKDVSSHYDRGNVLFKNMLDKRMAYSSGYWRDASDLDAAQEAKLDIICRKVGLKPGDRVLDIGCGWGSFMKFAAEKYGVSAVGVTLSKEQIALGEQLCEGLPVEFRLQDYRDLRDTFDHIISVGMFEHVGPPNYKTFMNIVHRNLKDDGLFLLHTIGANRPKDASDPFTDTYVFPGARLPVAEQIAVAAAGLFVQEDWHTFGIDYSPTLDAWYENFDRSWEGILSELYDERFYRMWKYMLLTSSGAFRARRDQTWQIVYSKRGVPGGYRSIR